MKRSIVEKQRMVEVLEKQIAAIQNKCTHAQVTKQHKSSTGNYDPSQDCYWTNFHCLICDKLWSEDGSK